MLHVISTNKKWGLLGGLIIDPEKVAFKSDFSNRGRKKLTAADERGSAPMKDEERYRRASAFIGGRIALSRKVCVLNLQR